MRNPSKIDVTSKVNTIHRKYGRLTVGQALRIDASDLGAEIFERVKNSFEIVDAHVEPEQEEPESLDDDHMYDEENNDTGEI